MLMQISDLSVTYANHGQPVHAVRKVSFDLDTAEAFGIVGESGCGKTSLVKAIIGIQPPSNGSIRFNGLNIHAMDIPHFKKYRRAVQMVFQDAVGSLNPRMTVQQTLAEVLHVHRVCAPHEIPARINTLLDRVGLAQQVLNAYPRELSGGQCQRISFARALALEPQVIIADEPVSALDVSVQARILNLIRDLRQNLNVAILLISHDLAVVRNVCDRVAVMYAGQFVECGPAETIFDTPQHPYTRTLLSAVPDVERALNQRRPPVVASA